MSKNLFFLGKTKKCREKNLSVLFSTFFLFLVSFAFGQILTFETNGLAGNEASLTSNTKHANLNNSSLTRGAGLNASANADRFNADNWATGSITNAVSGNDYMEFTITPQAGFQFSVSSIFFRIQRSGTGLTQIALRSSIDGYASDLDAVKSITDNTNNQDITFTFSQSNSTVPVTYRLYGYSEATGGSGGVESGSGNDLIVNGTVISTGPIPEINLKGNGNNIFSGDITPSTIDDTDFGSQNTGTNSDKTYIIENLGTADLTISSVSLSGANASDFSVISSPSTIASGSSANLIIRFNPPVVGTRNATVTINNNDANEGTYTFAIRGTGATLPEINLKGNGVSIVNGDSIPDVVDNTNFGGTNVTGGLVTKTFTIENLGSANLTVSTPTISGAHASDFTITANPTSPVATLGSTTFTVRFDPSATGTRTATVSIVNNDGDENPYTFDIQGEGSLGSGVLTMIPTTGPVNTLVTVTTSNISVFDLQNATVMVDGIATTLIENTSSKITFKIPLGATSGAVSITKSTTDTFTFNLITFNKQGCQSSVDDFVISEVTDSTVGSRSYVEIYNGTGNPIDLSNYVMKFYSNGNTTVNSISQLPGAGIIPTGTTYVLKFGCTGSSSPCAETCDDSAQGFSATTSVNDPSISGINFNLSNDNRKGHDYIELVKKGADGVSTTTLSTQADDIIVDVFGVKGNNAWGLTIGQTGTSGGSNVGVISSGTVTNQESVNEPFGDEGGRFRRKVTGTSGSTFVPTDWTMENWTDGSDCTNHNYSDLGISIWQPAIQQQAPTYTGNPVTITSCDGNFNITSATEGYNQLDDSKELAYQWMSLAPGSSTWIEVTNGGVISGATTQTLTFSDASNYSGYQFYLQIRENSQTCFRATQTAIIDSYVWNGTTWKSENTGTTTTRLDAINGKMGRLEADLTIDANGKNIDACSLDLNGYNLVLNSGQYVNVRGSIWNNRTTGSTTNIIDMALDTNLVQVNQGATINKPKIDIKTITRPIANHAWVHRSSPVLNNGNIWSSIPFGNYPTGDASQPTNQYRTGSLFILNNSAWVNQIDDSNLVPGRGFILRTTGQRFTNYPILASGNTNNTTTATRPLNFTGIANNGDYEFALQSDGIAGTSSNHTTLGDQNLIGNPYPSAINADDFLTVNSTDIFGTIYIWTSPMIGHDGKYPHSSGFATYNGTMGVASGTDGSFTPTKFIAPGQGFQVYATCGDCTGKKVVFSNDMRETTETGGRKFAREKETNNEKVYLSLKDHQTNLTSRIGIGYVEGATKSFDNKYDAPVISFEPYKFYSKANDYKVIINGRPKFDVQDVVSLGFEVASEKVNTFEISLDNKEGEAFANGTDILLRDKVLNVVHNLSKSSKYAFVSSSKEVSNRFEILYVDTKPKQEVITNDKTQVAVNQGSLVVKSEKVISSVEVHDLTGGLVVKLAGKGSNEVQSTIDSKSVYLIVKVTKQNGEVKTVTVLNN